MLYISDNQIFKKYPSSDLVTNSNIHDAKWFHYVAAYAVATLLLRGGQSPYRCGQYKRTASSIQVLLVQKSDMPSTYLGNCD